MNKTTIIVAAAIIILLGGGYAVYRNTGVPKSNPTLNSEATADKNGPAKTSIKSLLAGGQSLKCTYTQTVNGGTQQATTYIANGAMRGDIVMANYTMHTINDGEWNYTWGGPLGETQGVKMKIAAAPTANVNSSGQQNVNFDEELDYSCAPWNADATFFSVPSGVVFRDLARADAPMQVTTNTNVTTNVSTHEDVNAGSSGANKVNCSVCDQVPVGISKEQCLQSIGCL